MDTIKRSSVTDEVFKTIHNWILSSKFSEGDFLPSQDKLALRFSVSRNSVREALNKLSAMGLIKIKHGAGTVVQASGAASYITSIYEHLLLDPVDIRELFEARIGLERMAVRLASQRADAECLGRIQAIMQLQKKAMDENNAEEFGRQDLAFHMELVQASQNKVIKKFFSATWGLLDKALISAAKMPGILKPAFKHHCCIVDAIASKDAQRADQEMVKHLRDVASHIEKNFGVGLDVELLF